jgi:hypothetical protein
MNVVTVLHNKAMEFADEALLAKMEGNMQASAALFEKAFELEKEAANSVDEDRRDSESRYILIRSAASLALHCGKFHEAKSLIEVGLSGNPPSFIVEELKALEASMPREISDKVGFVEVIGVIIYANADNSEIRLQDIESKELYTITVPSHLINEIVKSYWADLVQVKAQKEPTGSIILRQIEKAA